jgi:hypothetical protein
MISPEEYERMIEGPAWNAACEAAEDWECSVKGLLDSPELGESEKAVVRQIMEDVRSVFQQKEWLGLNIEPLE